MLKNQVVFVASAIAVAFPMIVTSHVNGDDCEPAWSNLGAGMSGGTGAWALAVFDDGSGPALYAGGNFTIAGGDSANNIAKWDGTTWTALGTGVNHQVNALTVFECDLNDSASL